MCHSIVNCLIFARFVDDNKLLLWHQKSQYVCDHKKKESSHRLFSASFLRIACLLRSFNSFSAISPTDNSPNFVNVCHDINNNNNLAKEFLSIFLPLFIILSTLHTIITDYSCNCCCCISSIQYHLIGDVAYGPIDDDWSPWLRPAQSFVYTQIWVKFINATI